MRHSSRKGKQGRGRKVQYFGETFDSVIEGQRYLQLRGMQDGGEITDLECHPKFVLQEGFRDSDGKAVRAITYTADFQYTDTRGDTIVEDVKPLKKSRSGKRVPENTREGTLRVKMFQYKFRRYKFRLVGM